MLTVSGYSHGACQILARRLITVMDEYPLDWLWMTFAPPTPLTRDELKDRVCGLLGRLGRPSALKGLWVAVISRNPTNLRRFHAHVLLQTWHALSEIVNLAKAKELMGNSPYAVHVSRADYSHCYYLFYHLLEDDPFLEPSHRLLPRLH